MRKLIINGRIVNNAEKKTSRNGREYITFRFANNEFGDTKDDNGKPITYWFNITSYDTRHIALSKYLTKGRPINIIGQYSDNIYQNKNGNCEIGRNIIADVIEFEVGKPIDDNTSTNNNNEAPVSSPTTQTAMPTSPIPDDGDDLPF